MCVCVCVCRRARDKVVLQVRRSARETIRGRQRATGNSTTAAGNSSRPAPMTSSGRFRFAERPVVGDARMRRGVLAELPAAATSRPLWNRSGRRPASADVVTTDYGWIDSGDAAAAAAAARSVANGLPASCGSLPTFARRRPGLPGRRTHHLEQPAGQRGVCPVSVKLPSASKTFLFQALFPDIITDPR